MRQFINDKIKITCETLFSIMQKTVSEIPELKFIPCGYKSGQDIPSPDDFKNSLRRGERVSGRDGHFWFYTHCKTPSADENTKLMFEVITSQEGTWDGTNPQCLIYLNGEIVQGLDINHRQTPLEPDTEYDILLYFYNGMTDIQIDVAANIKAIDLTVMKLYYDLKVPYDAAMCFDKTDYSYIKIMKYLEQAVNRIDFTEPGSGEFYKSIGAASEYLYSEFYGKECGKSDAVVNLIGHTHIDIAWHWTINQTREKVQRSFATVLSLMEQYPEYVFMSSQPQLYEYLKEEAPDLYEKVKKKIKERRWEADGAMWLEADCNLTSGESLIRQIMYGKAFMKQEFDIDSRILWLPDVFGYSAALPQILKKTGVDKFVTSKISWNETNKLPYDSFMWEGLDGTEIFTYFLTARNHEKHCENDNETTYVGMVTPAMVLGTWERYQQKDFNNETIITFGYGDGGGGPTADMLESARRLQYGLPGMPRTQMSFAGDFLDRVQANFDKNCELTGRTPKWVGELYLEFHRGTYTSIAKNKKNNRECEFLCQEIETLSVMSSLFGGAEYPQKALSKAWKTLLLNQFHDIIPGSSIFEVYEESDREYAEVRENIGAIKNAALAGIAAAASKKGVLVYNPNSFAASGLVNYGGSCIYAEDVPAMGWKIVEPIKPENTVSVSNRTIESRHYTILFDANMNIISLYDKDKAREIIKEGAAANRMQIFEDYPRQYDNWEITDYYKDKMHCIDDLQSVVPISGEGFGGFEITRKYHNSVITQKIIVYSENRRIDFQTTADWHEHHVLLKTAFPTNIHTNKATYDIQFGNAERATHENTSWDAAKFEVCANKWGDISENGFGISLLNNCKYGYSANGGEIKLTLIKCGTDPNPQADQGMHSFTYSLLPHGGDFRTGGTIEQSYLLNRPLEAVEASGAGNLPESYSLVNSDCANIIIETVKMAENGNGIIIRLFDAWNKKSNPTLNFGFNAKKISLCDMLEQEICELGSGNSVTLPVNNFEIITLRAELE